MTRTFRAGKHSAALYERVAYLCRYLHAPLSEVLSLTSWQSEEFERACGVIVARENGDK